MWTAMNQSATDSTKQIQIVAPDMVSVMLQINVSVRMATMERIALCSIALP